MLMDMEIDRLCGNMSPSSLQQGFQQFALHSKSRHLLLVLSDLLLSTHFVFVTANIILRLGFDLKSNSLRVSTKFNEVRKTDTA